MGMLFPLFFTLLLARTSSIRVAQEVDGQHLKYPALHLPLFHMQGRHSLENSEPPLSFPEALALDEARVKSLNSKLIKNNQTAAQESGHLVDPEAVTIPLNPGVPIGVLNYYTNVGLGTPPSFYPVVIDTGSSFSWIQCEPCDVYCHPQVGPHFDPSSSTTYKSLSCDTSQCSSLEDATLNSPQCSSSNVCMYEASYGDKSYSEGYLSQDSLTLEASSEPALADFVFGCGQNNYGLFGQSAGLFGLARNELSMFSQLSTKYGKAFSYCLPTTDSQTGSGGFLSIGTTSSTTYKFTPILTDSRFPSLYFLKLSAITVSGKTLDVPSSEYNVPTFIDSGTVISRLAVSIYTALREKMVQIISSKYHMTEAYSLFDACFKGSLESMSAIVPLVQLTFPTGGELNLAPHNVLIEVSAGTTCLAFASNSDNIAIIGNHQQQTFEILYDISNSRIGFAAGGCS